MCRNAIHRLRWTDNHGGGNFFERVPDGCDAYLLKHIIHDWSDEHCRAISR